MKRDEGALYPLAVHIPVVFLLIHVRILEILILEGHQFRVGNFKLSNADKKNASIPELEGMRSVLAELAYFSGALAVKGQQSLLVQGNLPPAAPTLLLLWMILERLLLVPLVLAVLVLHRHATTAMLLLQLAVVFAGGPSILGGIKRVRLARGRSSSF